VTPTLVVVSGPPGSGKTTLAHKLAAAVGCPAISRDEIKQGMAHAAPGFTGAPGDEQDDPLRRVHAGLGGAAERDAAHRSFRRVSIDVPALEVDTSDGYRPPFGQILSFATGTMEP
jgi:cytidylate kinase